MGSGDWNDGMNRVGAAGRGESVWLGWFLYTTLASFAPVARARGERTRATKWLAHAATLRDSLEREAWDGNWYRRGYFDDGTPLGSAASAVCRIRFHCAVLERHLARCRSRTRRAGHGCGGRSAHPTRQRPGTAVYATVRSYAARSRLHQGVIRQGYARTGGQYTHAAAWSVMAHAMLGHGNQATELFTLLNPISHSSSRADVQRYKVEPYVIAADVYSVAPHAGRGGWTWYTGSAGWMYRVGLEWILGFRIQGASLLLAPCVPEHWPGFEISFNYRSARYRITVDNPHGVSRGVAHAELDGELLPPGGARIALVDDGATHQVRLILGGAWASAA